MVTVTSAKKDQISMNKKLLAILWQTNSNSMGTYPSWVELRYGIDREFALEFPRDFLPKKVKLDDIFEVYIKIKKTPYKEKYEND